MQDYRYYLVSRNDHNQFVCNFGNNGSLFSMSYIDINGYYPNTSYYPISFRSQESLEDHVSNEIVGFFNHKGFSSTVDLSILNSIKVIKTNDYLNHRPEQYVDLIGVCKKEVFNQSLNKKYGFRVANAYRSITNFKNRVFGRDVYCNNNTLNDVLISSISDSYFIIQDLLRNTGIDYRYYDGIVAVNREDIALIKITADESTLGKLTFYELMDLTNLEYRIAGSSNYIYL